MPRKIATDKLTHFGRELRALMKIAGFKTRIDLCRATEIENATIYRWEVDDSTTIQEHLLKRMASALGVSVEHLKDLRRISQKISSGTADANSFASSLHVLSGKQEMLDVLRELNATRDQRRCWSVFLRREDCDFLEITAAFMRGFIEAVPSELGEIAMETAIDRAADAGDNADTEARRRTLGLKLLGPSPAAPRPLRRARTR